MMKKFLSIFLFVVLLVACKQDVKNIPQGILSLYESKGNTMGTYYLVKFYNSQTVNLQSDIDSLLIEINAAVNTYDKNSLISAFNQYTSLSPFDLLSYDISLQKHMLANMTVSEEAYQISDQYFDPTVMPLVNYWGFGYEGRHQVIKADSTKVNNILLRVGWNKITFNDEHITKERPDVEIDFSAVAKGYAVDQLGEMLESMEIQNYYVEIGGESRANGLKSDGTIWTVGIAKPDPEAGLRETQRLFNLKDISVATSGNYRNNYQVDNEVRSHTINPKTGYPERSYLLSASIFHPQCARADALATSCMSMGMTKCIEMLEGMDQYLYYLIYIDEHNALSEKYSFQLNQYIK